MSIDDPDLARLCWTLRELVACPESLRIITDAYQDRREGWAGDVPDEKALQRMVLAPTPSDELSREEFENLYTCLLPTMRVAGDPIAPKKIMTAERNTVITLGALCVGLHRHPQDPVISRWAIALAAALVDSSDEVLLAGVRLLLHGIDVPGAGFPSAAGVVCLELARRALHPCGLEWIPLVRTVGDRFEII
jgi:hypothetical protein